MAKITLKEAAHVDIRIDGENIALDLTTGENDVPDPVAAILIAQGFATEATAKAGKNTNKAIEPIVDETTSETLEN